MTRPLSCIISSSPPKFTAVQLKSRGAFQSLKIATFTCEDQQRSPKPGEGGNPGQLASPVPACSTSLPSSRLQDTGADYSYLRVLGPGGPGVAWPLADSRHWDDKLRLKGSAVGHITSISVLTKLIKGQTWRDEGTGDQGI